jgi:hypothetical protein
VSREQRGSGARARTHRDHLRRRVDVGHNHGGAVHGRHVPERPREEGPAALVLLRHRHEHLLLPLPLPLVLLPPGRLILEYLRRRRAASAGGERAGAAVPRARRLPRVHGKWRARAAQVEVQGLDWISPRVDYDRQRGINIAGCC